MYTDLDEQELARRCSQGDRLAEDELYKRYAARVYTLCRRYLGNDEEAKDLMQESLIQALDKIQTFNGSKGSLDGWISRIAINKALNQIKRKRWRTVSLDAWSQDTIPAPQPLRGTGSQLDPSVRTPGSLHLQQRAPLDVHGGDRRQNQFGKVMMKQIAYIIIFLLTCIGAVSCVETIVMDPGEKDLPVMVNCLLTPDSKVQTLYLQYVKGKSAKEYIPITEAKVYVSSYFFTTTKKNYFHYVDGNRWESESFPVEGGRRYRLTVEIPGRDPIWAETTSPIAYRPALHTDLHEVHSMDYHSVYYQIEQFPTDKSHIKTSPVWVFAKGKLKIIEQCDENYPFIVTDHPYADDFNINGRKFSDLSFTGDFDGHCMSISWPAFHNMRRMMPELPLHDELVRIEHLDTNRFHILAGPIEYPKVGEPHQDHFVFSFVSDEYDKYLRSVYVKSRKTEHDITSIYSTESVYSNIEGGVGIFGSETTYRVGFLDM